MKVPDLPHPATPPAELDAASSLAECFRRTALRHPDRTAIHDDDAALRYRDVAGMAGGIARALTGAGLRAGERVGLLLDHGAAMVAAAFGTLAAGGCYVPLDPGYPAERLALMASEAGIRVLLTRAAHAGLASELASGLATLCTDDIGRGDLEVTDADPDRPAYVLYTSGSTGWPKGVAQTHRNVLHGVRNHLADFGIAPSDRLSLLSSFCFDMAVTDMYAALLSGATLVTVDVRRHGIGHSPGHSPTATSRSTTRRPPCTSSSSRHLASDGCRGSGPCCSAASRSAGRMCKQPAATSGPTACLSTVTARRR